MHWHDMWSSLGTEISWPSRKQQPREQPRRVHNHHISWRDRIRAFQHLQKQVVVRDPTKAVAWAVFQHHGHHSHSPGSSMAVRHRRRRPTRFKLEAQMKHEMAHRSLVPDVDIRRCWDAGSTLFDSFELDSLLKTLNQAAAEIDGAVVVEHDLHKHGHHHGMWRSLLHALHFDGLHWKLNHSQVSPHYNCSMEHKGRKEDGHIDVAQFDAQFDRNEVHVSKDVHDPSPGEEDVHHRRHLWKLLTHSFHGHKRHS